MNTDTVVVLNLHFTNQCHGREEAVPGSYIVPGTVHTI